MGKCAYFNWRRAIGSGCLGECGAAVAHTIIAVPAVRRELDGAIVKRRKGNAARIQNDMYEGAKIFLFFVIENWRFVLSSND